ncbi:hypothetical protein MKX03_021206 [Papaver bracteatum]|nr:hypothetical protein MKX03_021206 [Papaver bracteatum]
MEEEIFSIVSSVKGLRKGAWAEEEDQLLRKCIIKYGEGKWRQVPLRAEDRNVLKKFRLRWLNYLQPNIKRGEFQPDEMDLIIRMHKLLGNRKFQYIILEFCRWSLIAGRLPGRTANDIKNYFNTHLKKTCSSKYKTEKGKQVVTTKRSGHDSSGHRDDGQDHGNRQILKRKRSCSFNTTDHIDDKHIVTGVFKPQARTFKKSQWNTNNLPTPTGMNNNHITTTTTRFPSYSQVINKDITKCLPLLVDDQVSNGQQIHDNNTHWVKNILFSKTEEEEEDPMPKKKKNKRVTCNNNASKFESNTTRAVEEGMTTKDTNDGSNDDQHAHHCSLDDGKGWLEEGGSAGDTNNFWDSYLDENLWPILVEEQEQYLMM